MSPRTKEAIHKLTGYTVEQIAHEDIPEIMEMERGLKYPKDVRIDGLPGITIREVSKRSRK